MAARGVHVLVDLADIFVEVFTDGGEFAAIDTHHAKMADLGEQVQLART